MRRFAMWVLVAVMASGSGVARASGRHGRWKSVENLAPGKAIEVEVDRQVQPERCLLVSVDDAALTCEREADPRGSWGPADTARVVVPRNAVRAVWVWDDASGDHALVGLGIGFAVGALICAPGGPATAFACAGLGALIGLAVSAMPEIGPRYPWPGMPPPGYPVHQPDWRLKLVYRAPAGAVTP